VAKNILILSRFIYIKYRTFLRRARRGALEAVGGGLQKPRYPAVSRGDKGHDGQLGVEIGAIAEGGRQCTVGRTPVYPPLTVYGYRAPLETPDGTATQRQGAAAIHIMARFTLHFLSQN
jgi:hypothetical protein